MQRAVDQISSAKYERKGGAWWVAPLFPWRRVSFSSKTKEQGVKRRGHTWYSRIRSRVRPSGILRLREDFSNPTILNGLLEFWAVESTLPNVEMLQSTTL